MTGTVTAEYLTYAGAPAKGTVTFGTNTTDQQLRDPDGNVVYTGPRKYRLVAGALEVDLPGTDDVAFAETGWQYWARIELDGAPPALRWFELPDGDTVDLADIAGELSPGDPLTHPVAQADLDAALGASTVLAGDVRTWALASVSHIDHIAPVGDDLARCSFDRFNITGLGHSLMFGYWANDDGTFLDGSDPRLRQRGYARRSQERLCRRFGVTDPGEGVILMADSRVTTGGATGVGSLGITKNSPGGYRMHNTNGLTVTLTLDTPGVEEVWVHGWQQTDGECNPWYYTIDGGSDILCTTAQGFPTSGSDLDYTVKIRGLDPAEPHTIVIKSAVGNLIDLAGFSAWGDPTAGIAFNRQSVGGAYLDSAIYAMADGGNPRPNRLTVGRADTDLLVIQYGTNEMTTTGEGTGHTPALYETLLEDFLGYVTTTLNKRVLLVSTCEHDSGALDSYTEDDYYDIHESIAAANSKVAHWDWRLLPELADYATADAAGLMYDDIHLNAKGHALVGLAFEHIIASLAPALATVDV
jgi:hypothetical protein